MRFLFRCCISKHLKRCSQLVDPLSLPECRLRVIGLVLFLRVVRDFTQTPIFASQHDNCERLSLFLCFPIIPHIACDHSRLMRIDSSASCSMAQARSMSIE